MTTIATITLGPPEHRGYVFEASADEIVTLQHALFNAFDRKAGVRLVIHSKSSDGFAETVTLYATESSEIYFGVSEHAAAQVDDALLKRYEAAISQRREVHLPAANMPPMDAPKAPAGPILVEDSEKPIDDIGF